MSFSPHQSLTAATLSTGTDYEVDITEQLPNGTPTGAVLKLKFSPASTLLTLSLGTLLSEIEQRTYTTVKDPTNTAQNLVAVNGSGRLSPLGVALLNYEIPKASNPTIGLTVSTGLVLRFGSSGVSASSLGWFGGAGFHLYHRFFLSTGAHVGQFNDFPAGLERSSVVPANYGTLAGPTRTTTRFAFAITYQTKKFSTGSTTAKTTGGTTP